MAAINFDQMWEAVKTLAPDELQRLRALVDALLANPNRPLTKQDEMDLRLLKRGVITEIPPPITDLTPYEKRKPIEVQGKPVSETIIEERR